MTLQSPEELVDGGELYATTTTPLEDYFKLTGRRPALKFGNMACARCYLGTWEIGDGRLYLVALAGTIAEPSSDETRPATLTDVFPGAVGRVPADWYSGALHIPQGKLIGYRFNFFPILERDLIITIEKGHVVGREVRKNELPPPDRPTSAAPPNLLARLRAWVARL